MDYFTCSRLVLLVHQIEDLQASKQGNDKCLEFVKAELMRIIEAQS